MVTVTKNKNNNNKYQLCNGYIPPKTNLIFEFFNKAINNFD